MRGVFNNSKCLCRVCRSTAMLKCNAIKRYPSIDRTHTTLLSLANRLPILIGKRFCNCNCFFSFCNCGSSIRCGHLIRHSLTIDQQCLHYLTLMRKLNAKKIRPFTTISKHSGLKSHMWLTTSYNFENFEDSSNILILIKQ